MSNVLFFLKVLKNEGYPNSNIRTIAKFIDYDLENFLIDLKEEIGDEKLQEFINKGMTKFSTPKGILIEWPDTDEYIYVKVIDPKFDVNESEQEVYANIVWGESKLLSSDYNGNETYKTIEEILDESDMGDSDTDELIDQIKGKLWLKSFSNLGYGISSW